MGTLHRWIISVDECGGRKINLEGRSFQTAIMFEFPTMNNMAEYEALINGLEMAMAISIKRLQVYTDSQFVVCQVSGEYAA